jgi:hypothetical protein
VISQQFTECERMQMHMDVNKCYVADVVLMFLGKWMPWKLPNKSNFSQILSVWTKYLITLGVIFIYPSSKVLLTATSS